MVALGRSCVITGTNGYLGSVIKYYLGGKGWIIHELRHDLKEPNPDNPLLVPFSLKEGADPSVFQDIDVLIHCAYDFTLSTWEAIKDVNINGSLRLFEDAKRSGVKKLIFVSTNSAYEGSRSLYGKAKLAIERGATAMGAIVVRPGLVYGRNSGGVFGTLDRLISSNRIVPLVGKGEQALYLIHQEDLAQLIYHLCATNAIGFRRPIVAAFPRKTTLKEILETIARARRKKPLLLPISWRFIWLALKACERTRLPFGFRSDSLVSLLNQNPDPDFESIPGLGFSCREFNEQTLLS